MPMSNTGKVKAAFRPFGTVMSQTHTVLLRYSLGYIGDVNDPA